MAGYDSTTQRRMAAFFKGRAARAMRRAVAAARDGGSIRTYVQVLVGGLSQAECTRALGGNPVAMATVMPSIEFAAARTATLAACRALNRATAAVTAPAATRTADALAAAVRDQDAAVVATIAFLVLYVGDSGGGRVASLAPRTVLDVKS